MTYMILVHAYGCVGREYGINARAQYVGKYQSCMVLIIECIQCTRAEYTCPLRSNQYMPEELECRHGLESYDKSQSFENLLESKYESETGICFIYQHHP